MERWCPKQEPTPQEQFILKRLETKRSSSVSVGEGAGIGHDLSHDPLEVL